MPNGEPINVKYLTHQLSFQLSRRLAAVVISHALRITRTMGQLVRSVEVRVGRDTHTEALNQLATEPTA